MVSHCISEEMDVPIYKVIICVTAKGNEDSCRPLEMEALGRKLFGPVGTLFNVVALGYVFLSFHGVLYRCLSTKSDICL
jgi:hypothetical protein